METVTKHRVTTSKQVTREEFLQLFALTVRDRINANIDKEGVDGCVCFENIDMCSSNLGARSALIYGPGCNGKTLDELLDNRLGDVPSRFQYPTYHFVKS